MISEVENIDMRKAFDDMLFDAENFLLKYKAVK